MILVITGFIVAILGARRHLLDIIVVVLNAPAADDEPPPPPGSSQAVVEAYRQRRMMRRAGRGPQYGDAMIGPVEEMQLHEEATRHKARLGKQMQAR